MQNLTEILSDRAAAPAAVCASHPPPRLAVCLVGTFVGGDATLHSLLANVVLALGALQHTAVFASLAVPLGSDNAARSIDQILHPVAVRLHAAGGGTAAAECRGNRTGFGEHDSGHDERLRPSDVWHMRDCLSLIRTHEKASSTAARFDAVLLAPADTLFVLPLWPHCFYSPPLDRRFGRVLWLTRQSADAIFSAHHHRKWCGEVEGTSQNAGGLGGINVTIDRRLQIAVGFATALGSHRARLDCRSWEALSSAHRTWTAIVHPPCPDRAVATAAKAASHGGSAAARLPRLAQDDAAVGETVRLVCAGAGVPPPRVAILLGGLARTFSRTLVYQTLRGHMIMPLGAASSVLFAHLRLGDVRGMTGAKGKDFSATIRTSAKDVMGALEALGAAPENVVVAENSGVGPPSCSGSGGMYDRRAADRREPANSSASEAVRRPASTCDNYGLPCSQHIIDGMLATRAALYRMVVRHEQRHSMRFDTLIYARPDLVALLPWLPWCFYDPHTARSNQDWLHVLPRALAEAPLQGIHDDYYACKLPEFTLMGRDYIPESVSPSRAVAAPGRVAPLTPPPVLSLVKPLCPLAHPRACRRSCDPGAFARRRAVELYW